MSQERPFSNALQSLRDAGLRPTRQRMALARLLLEGPKRHVTAERLHEQAVGEGVRVSLATVYNTLHQFTEAGLLREVVVDAGRTYFDTNTGDHHHFFLEDSNELVDIDGGRLQLAEMPEAPAGTEISQVDIVIRLRQSQ
jgi:Fur family iron response transcriptional regulator